MTIHIIEKDERESKFAQLRALGAELSVPVPEVFVTRKIENPGCETIIKEGRSHTWVRNYYNLIFGASMGTLTTAIAFTAAGSFGAGSLKIKASTNNELDPTNGAYLTQINTSTGMPQIIANGGIWIGTGDTAYSFEQYAMSAIVSHGTATGNLVYGVMAHQTPVYTAETKQWAQTIKRVFNNNSDASITIKETGLAGTYSILNARDVLASTDTINVGGQYTVTYTVKLTFPA